MTNTNKLIRNYQGCDGGKTGYTGQAGFCLAATALREETRLISVVIGAESSEKRFASTRNLLDYAFRNYESQKLLVGGAEVGKIEVQGSKTSEVPIVAERTVSTFAKKGEKLDVSLVYDVPQKLKAPLSKGEKVGEVIAYLNGVETDRCALLLGCDAEKYSWWEAFQEGTRCWN
jgi:D-alanyl-D-alanine carboxypeptidase (penicillin-binding protein 5/6)